MTQRDAEILLAEAFELIDQRRLDATRKIGLQLIASRFTGGFEVLARVQMIEGNHEGAVATLRSGLSSKRVWRLANLLGNCLSDLERYEEAFETYERSAGMFGDQPDVTRLNRAIALSRAGLDADARNEILGLVGRDYSDAVFSREVCAVAKDLRVCDENAL